MKNQLLSLVLLFSIYATAQENSDPMVLSSTQKGNIRQEPTKAELKQALAEAEMKLAITDLKQAVTDLQKTTTELNKTIADLKKGTSSASSAGSTGPKSGEKMIICSGQDVPSGWIVTKYTWQSGCGKVNDQGNNAVAITKL
jgi:paraquat-inducible protein B